MDKLVAAREALRPRGPELRGDFDKAAGLLDEWLEGTAAGYDSQLVLQDRNTDALYCILRLRGAQGHRSKHYFEMSEKLESRLSARLDEKLVEHWHRELHEMLASDLKSEDTIRLVDPEEGDENGIAASVFVAVSAIPPSKVAPLLGSLLSLILPLAGDVSGPRKLLALQSLTALVSADKECVNFHSETFLAAAEAALSSPTRHPELVLRVLPVVLQIVEEREARVWRESVMRLIKAVQSCMVLHARDSESGGETGRRVALSVINYLVAAEGRRGTLLISCGLVELSCLCMERCCASCNTGEKDARAFRDVEDSVLAMERVLRLTAEWRCLESRMEAILDTLVLAPHWLATGMSESDADSGPVREVGREVSRVLGEVVVASCRDPPVLVELLQGLAQDASKLGDATTAWVIAEAMAASSTARSLAGPCPEFETALQLNGDD